MIRSASAKKPESTKPNQQKRRPDLPTDGPRSVPKLTKLELLESMLRRPEGATKTQLMLALNWQHHSVRGVISGTLKKKKCLKVNLEKAESGERIYRIAE